MNALSSGEPVFTYTESGRQITMALAIFSRTSRRVIRLIRA
jgi:hypothetical protein